MAELHNADLSEEKAPDLTAADSLDVAKAVVRILDAKKAGDIKLLHVEEQTTIADYFVICTGNSRTQVNSLADEVEFKLSQSGLSLLRKEGGSNGVWTLLDYGPVIVHVFGREGREFYNLEKLYDAGSEVPLQDILSEN